MAKNAALTTDVLERIERGMEARRLAAEDIKAGELPPAPVASRKHKPTAAEKQAYQRRQDFEALQLQQEQAVLPSHSLVSVERTTQTNVQRARRESILERLITMRPDADADDEERRLITMDNKRRRAGLDKLCDLLALRYHEDRDTGPRQRTQGGLPAAEVSEAQIAAGRQLDALVIWGGEPIAMLVELIRPTVSLPWRVVVEQHTRERLEPAQAAAVRSAANILAQGLDRRIGQKTSVTRLSADDRVLA